MKTFWKVLFGITALVIILTMVGGDLLTKQLRQLNLKNRPMVTWNTTDGEVIKELSYGESYRNTYDLYLPANPQPKALMLFIHGGSWTHGEKEDMEWAAKRYAQEGYIAASINYSRLKTDSIIRQEQIIVPSIESMLGEIDLSIVAIKQKCHEMGCDLKQMAVGGYSAGGHLAMLYASRYAQTSAIPIKFHISWVGPSDFNRLFPTPNTHQPIGGPHAEAAEKFSTMIQAFIYAMSGKMPTSDELTAENFISVKSCVSPVDVAHSHTSPAILAYGGNDQLVNALHGEVMAQKLSELGVDNRLIIFPNSGHGLEADPECSDSLKQAILDYCDKYFE